MTKVIKAGITYSAWVPLTVSSTGRTNPESFILADSL